MAFHNDYMPQAEWDALPDSLPKAPDAERPTPWKWTLDPGRGLALVLLDADAATADGSRALYWVLRLPEGLLPFVARCRRERHPAAGLRLRWQVTAWQLPPGLQSREAEVKALVAEALAATGWLFDTSDIAGSEVAWALEAGASFHALAPATATATATATAETATAETATWTTAAGAVAAAGAAFPPPGTPAPADPAATSPMAVAVASPPADPVAAAAWAVASGPVPVLPANRAAAPWHPEMPAVADWRPESGPAAAEEGPAAQPGQPLRPEVQYEVPSPFDDIARAAGARRTDEAARKADARGRMWLVLGGFASLVLLQLLLGDISPRSVAVLAAIAAVMVVAAVIVRVLPTLGLVIGVALLLHPLLMPADWYLPGATGVGLILRWGIMGVSAFFCWIGWIMVRGATGREATVEEWEQAAGQLEDALEEEKRRARRRRLERIFEQVFRPRD